MSNPEYNPDEYEEIIPEEEGEGGAKQEEEDEDLSTIDAEGPQDLSGQNEDLSGHTDISQTPEPINEEEQEPISHRPNNFQPINDKRQTDKKARSIRFIKTFIRNKNKTLGEVARELNITQDSAKRYLADYVSLVVKAVESGTYPNMVVQYYNDPSMPKHQRLTAQDVQDMKPIILRYHTINIDALVASIDKPDKSGIYRPPRGQHNPIIKSFVDDVMGGGESSPHGALDDDSEEQEEELEPLGRFKKFNEFKQSRPVSNPRELTTESSIGDVIEFGIINSGQPDAARIKRIKTMFMSNPPHYLSDESRFQDLLEANDIKPKVITTFMDWLKYTAPIRPNERIGFLASARAQGPTYAGANQLTMQPRTQNGQQPFKKFDINDYDEYAQFLYTEGVYQYGLPPDHPINKQSYQRYMDDKKYEEDQKRTMRQIDMMVKQNILRMGPGGQMMGGPQGGQQNGPVTAFDENYLINAGILLPEITYTEDGKKITRLIPTGRTLNGGGFIGGMMGANQQQDKDDFTDSISKFSRFLEAVRPMMQQPQSNGQPASNPLLDRVMEAAINKLFSKADETPSKVLENQMSLFQQFKQLFPTTDNQPLNETQARLQIELAKLNTDKEFHMQEVDFKRRQLEMEEKRHEEAKSESKDGISMIFDALGKGFNIIQPVLTSLLMGQGGGGLSGMLGGALGGMGGGGQQPPMGPMGGGMPPDMMGGMGNPFTMPPQQGGGETEIMDNIPSPSNIPQDFMPQPQASPYETSYTPSPPVYQAAGGPQSPYQPEPPFPQMQPPPDFLPETPPEPFAVPPPKSVQSENDFLNSLTPEDLATLSVDELAEVEKRISSKQNKLEKVLNSIKKTKVSKQFGYKQQTIIEPDVDYSALDVPKDIPSDYDGMPDYTPEAGPEPVVGGEMDENVPSEAEQTQDFEQGANQQLSLEQQLLNTSLEPIDFESFNNDVIEITDMGNDNQQFNQQNEANQKDFIDKMAAIDAAEKLRVENEKRKAAGLAPLTSLNENINGAELSGDAAKAIDSPLNNDVLNNDPSLNETHTGPSDEFTKDAQKEQQQHSKKDKSTKQQSHKGHGNTNTNHASTDETKTVGLHDLGSPSSSANKHDNKNHDKVNEHSKDKAKKDKTDAENEADKDVTISNTTANTTEKTVKTDLS